MPLPMFNPEGTGPQGVGGIPPEEFQKGLTAEEAALVNAGQTAEQSPGSRRVMDGEVQSVMRELGLTLPQAPTAAPATPNTPTAETPQAGLAAAAPAPEETPDAKLRGIIDKYGGDSVKIAQAYLETDQARARSQQAAAAIERQYTDEIQRLGGQLQSLQGQLAEWMERGGTPPQPQTQTTQPQATDFWSDPTGAIRQTVTATVQEQLTAYAQAQELRERQNKFEQVRQSKAEEIERLKGPMRDIYRRYEPYYSQLPPEVALDMVLDQARVRDDARRLSEFVGQLQAAGIITAPNGNGSAGAVVNGGGGQVVVAPGAGGPGMGGGVGARTVQQPASPPGGDWSRTPAMNGLLRSREGGTDEMGALMKVLEERGAWAGMR